jgi:hypothetical protein
MLEAYSEIWVSIESSAEEFKIGDNNKEAKKKQGEW